MVSCDVVIMGGGIAGGFLARQLKLERPELDIRVLEAAHVIDDFKVGESTVEVAAHYMIRKLQLGTYLYQHQLPKNGLRFFFDSADKDLPLEEMSEIGSDRLPFHPSFQLERAALERDLAEMNRAAGIGVELGAKVVEIAVDASANTGPGTGHKVTYEQGGERKELHCRWLCDASGRRHLLNRTLGHKVHKEERLPTAAAWGRYSNVKGLDAGGSAAWKQRVRYTSRHLSTNHLMYDGYWLWFIPLAGDLMSVGAVYDKDRLPNGPRNREAFESFLQTHRAARDLMEGAVFHDFQSYAHLPYYSDTYFSRDRWALTGEAGAFTDPFYSPGSDFIATANEFIASMIASDLDGDTTGFHAKVDAYNAYYSFKYETTIRLYIKLYKAFGSFEIFRLKYLLDFNNYYNLVVWPFMADKLTDATWLKDELRFSDRILQAQSTMADHFSTLAEKLLAAGEYHAHNRGEWANGLCGVSQFETRLGPVLDAEFRRDEVQKAYGSVFASVLERATGHEGLATRANVLAELNFPTVVLFKDLGEPSLQRFLQRVGGRIAKDLRREFPDARVESVDISPRGVTVRGLDDGAREAVQARASEMWNARTASLTSVRI